MLIDELDNPEYPGGRKSVIEHCLEVLRALPPKRKRQVGASKGGGEQAPKPTDPTAGDAKPPE